MNPERRGNDLGQRRRTEVSGADVEKRAPNRVRDERIRVKTKRFEDYVFNFLVFDLRAFALAGRLP